jgi:hypothetical protein
MMAALKDTPAKEFRMPPGLRMYRVSPTTGLPAGAGEPAIWEGYKPGTEPGVDPMPVLPPVAGEPREAIAAAPVAASPAFSGAPGSPTVAGPTADAPAGGTGGLY